MGGPRPGPDDPQTQATVAATAVGLWAATEYWARQGTGGCMGMCVGTVHFVLRAAISPPYVGDSWTGWSTVGS